MNQRWWIGHKYASKYDEVDPTCRAIRPRKER